MAIPKKRVTILDIARAVGVTDGTVSRALTGDPRVRPETRERVLEASRKLGYRPNLAARYFKQGQTRTIGIILECGYWLFYNPYYGRLIAGLADAAREDDRRLTFFFPEIEPSPDSNPAHDVVHTKGFNEVFDGRLDGAVLVTGRRMPDDVTRALLDAPVPVVLFNTNQPVPGFFQLGSGAAARTKAAALALMDAGHKKVGMLGLYPDQPYTWACLKALQEAHEARSLFFNPETLVSSEHWDVSNPDYVQRALDKALAKDVTGLIISDASQAVTALELLKRRGVRIPADLSLVSFGPLPHGARMVDPQITMFQADLIEAGRETYRLFKEASDQKPPRSVEIPWTLQQGGTLGPARN